MMKSTFLALTLATVVASCTADLAVETPTLECNPEGREPLLEAFPVCDLGICGEGEAARAYGRCVDDTQLAEESLARLAPCANGFSHCVPNDILVSGGKFTPKTCTSVRGAEGRCRSVCLVAVQAKLESLPVDVCAENERCAPCYDPITGESTGACDASVCDAPTQPPVTFEHCCSDRAVCVPSASVPADSRDRLERKTCAYEDDLCVPLENTDPTYEPPACSSILGEGRCISTCVPAVDSPFVPQANCAEGYKCAPCSQLPEGSCD